jgi:TPR repeat protein
MDISQIEPWVDPAPSHERDMRLDQIRQQIKKKKPWAYRYLALRYEKGGRGLKRSLKKAFVNWKKGATLGDPVCMDEMGKTYDYGFGVAVNDKLAFEHYQMGAFIKGYDCAQYNLGDCY